MWVWSLHIFPWLLVEPVPEVGVVAGKRPGWEAQVAAALPDCGKEIQMVKASVTLLLTQLESPRPWAPLSFCTAILPIVESCTVTKDKENPF